MANEEQQQQQQKKEEKEEEDEEEDEKEEEEESSTTTTTTLNEQLQKIFAPFPPLPDFPDSDSDSSYDSDYSYDDEPQPQQPQQIEDTEFQKSFRFRFRRSDQPLSESENTAEANFRDFAEVLDSKRVKKINEEEDPEFVDDYNPFDFPEDPENWTEADLRELWDDGPPEIGGTGWDPAFAEPDDWEYVQDELAEGRKPPIAPFYLPYRKPFPAIPDNHFDIATPKAVIHELDRIEEFLKWVSYIFADGSSYEGTVWDDYAHGRGVFASEDNLVRYEGEWFQNQMEGHGVVEVDIPDIEPAPGSKLEAKMRAQGKILKMDYMMPEDREWLEMDIEDSYRLADGAYEIPFYENEEWVRQFGRKPEKGRYRYAGQWKHGRMHGCGVYELNERTIYGRFYFGNLVDEDEHDGCDDETSALHAGIAEVAAAKARMFINKPDGMVREERGPYNDPQHPYFYEEDDVWMAPGFINQFYEVPDYWKTYVREVDQEREMWLNSFYKSPLRLPMPAELEYWWSKEENHETPEFIVFNKEPEPDPDDPSNLIYTEDPLILHTPSGRIINYIEDEEHGIRLFWQPPLKKGEDVDPEKAVFLPLGYDEFFGREPIEQKESIWTRLLLAIEKACQPWLDKLNNMTEELKKKSEMNKKEMGLELELLDAELKLEEAIAELDMELKRIEEEEELKAEMGLPEDGDEDDTNDTINTISETKDEEAPAKAEEEEDEEGDEEEEDDVAQSSFGSVEQEQTTDQQKGKPGKAPFSTSSLAFASSSLISVVPSKLLKSFSFWNKGGSKPELISPIYIDRFSKAKTVDSVSFRPLIGQKCSLKAVGQTHGKVNTRSYSGRKLLDVHRLSQSRSCFLASEKSKNNLKAPRVSSDMWLHAAPERDLDSILSLHSTIYDFEEHRKTTI
ncbi:hypothetical protein Lal_00010300 [Lupinus albus]|uniref:Putative transcription elongation factor S-II, central domain-containing protein n=1 Tax=Lupinus albus TaxID=3870 RepID=A0A6A5LEX4_LUPAL|nr:putative transcription elongation factor S-II, central domain-containing protein [Lupinus albus]KAF1859716.1 hypothetical protein Lal_00010300 [Lupinus albus]